MKDIIDVCCGGRMFWFDKENKDVLYVDKHPRAQGCIPEQKNFQCEPDLIADYRNIPYDDNSFAMVVFDPPHRLFNFDSIMKEKYGSLSPDWKGELSDAMKECMRICKEGGFIVFKWNETSHSVSEVLEAIPFDPLFGHTTGKAGKTKWMIFRKNDLSSCSADHLCQECKNNHRDNLDICTDCVHAGADYSCLYSTSSSLPSVEDGSPPPPPRVNPLSKGKHARDHGISEGV